MRLLVHLVRSSVTLLAAALLTLAVLGPVLLGLAGIAVGWLLLFAISALITWLIAKKSPNNTWHFLRYLTAYGLHQIIQLFNFAYYFRRMVLLWICVPLAIPAVLGGWKCLQVQATDAAILQLFGEFAEYSNNNRLGPEEDVTVLQFIQRYSTLPLAKQLYPSSIVLFDALVALYRGAPAIEQSTGTLRQQQSRTERRFDRRALRARTILATRDHVDGTVANVLADLLLVRLYVRQFRAGGNTDFLRKALVLSDTYTARLQLKVEDREWRTVPQPLREAFSNVRGVILRYCAEYAAEFRSWPRAANAEPHEAADLLDAAETVFATMASDDHMSNYTRMRAENNLADLLLLRLRLKSHVQFADRSLGLIGSLLERLDASRRKLLGYLQFADRKPEFMVTIAQIDCAIAEAKAQQIDARNPSLQNASWVAQASLDIQRHLNSMVTQLDMAFFCGIPRRQFETASKRLGFSGVFNYEPPLVYHDGTVHNAFGDCRCRLYQVFRNHSVTWPEQEPPVNCKEP